MKLFVTSFGIHYTNDIRMGAKATYINVFDKSSYSKMSAGGVDVSAAASASFGVFSGSASTSVSKHYKDYQAFPSALATTPRES